MKKGIRADMGNRQAFDRDASVYCRECEHYHDLPVYVTDVDDNTREWYTYCPRTGKKIFEKILTITKRTPPKHTFKTIVRPRQSGKTMDLIEYAAENNATIVVPTHRQIKYVTNLAKKMGLNIPTPITYTKSDLKGHRGPFIVDNAELILADLLGARPIAVSMSGIPEIEYDEIGHPEKIERREKLKYGK